MSTMTEREMLEWAAKANGFQVKGWIGKRLSFYDPIRDSAEYEWNPLTDDGDAMRLVVALGLDLIRTDAEVEAIAGLMPYVESGSYTASSPRALERLGSDKFSATRLAIVKAAAEIGRSKHE